MSTYSLAVSGPSTRLAMLGALATKMLNHLTQVWDTVKVTVFRTSRGLKATATTGLAVVGSPAGYQLVRHATAAALAGVTRVTSAGMGLLTRGVQAASRLVLAALDLVSPAAADMVAELADGWITQPLRDVANHVACWTQDAAALVWELSDTSLVRAVTTRAAQVASVVLGVHALTKGAAAAKVVHALPWAMDAVLVATNPGWAALGVAAAFTVALVFAAFRVLDGPENDPEEVDPDETADEPLTAVTTLPLVDETVPDLREVAAVLSVEVTADGSLVVHGIPDTLPPEVGLQVAHIAADAATARLERILIHRPELTRDDRRLLTKVAREAVRVQRRLIAS